jgi:hypothetical protein
VIATFRIFEQKGNSIEAAVQMAAWLVRGGHRFGYHVDDGKDWFDVLKVDRAKFEHAARLFNFSLRWKDE